MQWDWKIDSFKILMAGLIGWGGKEVAKRFLPVVNVVKRVYKIEELEQESAITKSKLMAILHISTDPMFISNPKGELIYVNPSWSEMTGIDSNDAHGLWFSVAVHPDSEIEMKKRGDMSVLHTSPYFGLISYKHADTGKIIKTYCRSELVHDKEDKHIETVARLSIIKD